MGTILSTHQTIDHGTSLLKACGRALMEIKDLEKEKRVLSDLQHTKVCKAFDHIEHAIRLLESVDDQIEAEAKGMAAMLAQQGSG